MLTYYKCVRSDYTDCRTGMLSYHVGSVVRHPNPEPVGDEIHRQDACGRRWLHACHRPEHTLQFRNSQWPVRLLKVSAQDKDLRADDGTKVGAVALTVVEELPLACAFGPNGEAVAQFITGLSKWQWLRADRTKDAEVVELAREHMRRLQVYGFKPLQRVRIKKMTLAAARTETWAAARDAAWAAAMAAAKSASRAAAMAAARTAAWDGAWEAAWAAAWAAARGAAWAASGDIAGAAAWAAARSAAWESVADLMHDRPNPFEPVTAIWRAGFWPVGPYKGDFLIAAVQR